jgi:putative sigma-54 modulation protein
MIEKIEIEGIHLEVDDNMRRYVLRKIGRLDKYLPKHAKESAHAEVMLKNTDDKTNHATCEVTLFLPKETINVHESTINIYAAIDIVEAKLKHRIQKYKDLHTSVKFSRHLIGKFRKKAAQNF